MARLLRGSGSLGCLTTSSTSVKSARGVIASGATPPAPSASISSETLSNVRLGAARLSASLRACRCRKLPSARSSWSCPKRSRTLSVFNFRDRPLSPVRIKAPVSPLVIAAISSSNLLTLCIASSLASGDSIASTCEAISSRLAVNAATCFLVAAWMNSGSAALPSAVVISYRSSE